MFTYWQSSGTAQTTLNADTSYRRPAFVVRLDGSATLTTRRDDTERDDRGFMELWYVRYRGRRWFVSGATRFESNESLVFLLRSQVAGLVGQRIVNTNRGQFALAAGLVVNDERAVDAAPTQRTDIEGVLGLETTEPAADYTYDRPKTQFDARVQYYPSLSNWGRQRFQLDTGLRYELLKDFFAALNVYESFDSAPPNLGSSRNDVGTLLLVWLVLLIRSTRPYGVGGASSWARAGPRDSRSRLRRMRRVGALHRTVLAVFTGVLPSLSKTSFGSPPC